MVTTPVVSGLHLAARQSMAFSKGLPGKQTHVARAGFTSFKKDEKMTRSLTNN
jgi:hypothetical protein